MQNIDAVTIEVVALGASESQRKLKPAAPSEPVWLSFGVIICFIMYDCTDPCVNMFNITTRSKHDRVSLKIHAGVVVSR